MNPPRTTKKILVISPSWVGDSVLAQPLYRRLHQRYPKLELHVFAPQWTMPLLSRMPEVTARHLNFFEHGSLRLRQRWKVARELASEHFDQAIVLPNSLKSALIPLLASIPTRTGFVGETRYGFLNDIRTLDKKALPTMVERFCALAEDPHQAIIPRPIAYPTLTVDLASQTQVISTLNLTTERPLVAFCPGAEYGPAKRWPAHHFAKLAQRFDDAGFTVWLLGSLNDQAIGEQIRTLSGQRAINLCGQTTLDEGIDLMGHAQIAICNDSGLMHIAAALGKPLLALYGSSSPSFTPPLSTRASILTLDVDCSPCFARQCPYGHMKCLETLMPEQVWQAAAQLLGI